MARAPHARGWVPAAAGACRPVFGPILRDRARTPASEAFCGACRAWPGAGTCAGAVGTRGSNQPARVLTASMRAPEAAPLPSGFPRPAGGPAVARPGCRRVARGASARWQTRPGATPVPADDGALAGTAGGIVRGGGEAVARGVALRGRSAGFGTGGAGGRIGSMAARLRPAGAEPWDWRPHAPGRALPLWCRAAAVLRCGPSSDRRGGP